MPKYFETFPNRLYDIKGNGNLTVVTDIFRRMKVREGLKDNMALMSTYDIQEGDTPEIISFKHFGTTDYFWVICYMNDITDRYHQWPMTGGQFIDYLNDKYTNPDGIHHYESTQTSGDTKIKIEVFNEVDEDAYTGLTPITNREYEEQEQDKRRQIRLVDPSFVEQFVDEFKKLMNETII